MRLKILFYFCDHFDNLKHPLSHQINSMLLMTIVAIQCYLHVSSIHGAIFWIVKYILSGIETPPRRLEDFNHADISLVYLCLTPTLQNSAIKLL